MAGSSSPQPHPAAAAGADAAALLQRTPPVIKPGHTFESVTESISHTVLTRKTPIG